MYFFRMINCVFVISFEIGVSVLTPMVGRMLNIEFHYLLFLHLFVLFQS